MTTNSSGYHRVVRRLADLRLPRIVSVDGRSGSGKSTIAARIADSVPGAAVVHTDDVAWHHSFFGWGSLLAEGVLAPLRAGAAVAYRPPGWVDRGRSGAITVPADAPLVLVEGVGAGQRLFADLVDALIWVEIDSALAHDRCVRRDGPGELGFIAEWEAQEQPFLEHERPWERADLVVDGAPSLPHDPATELVVLTRG